MRIENIRIRHAIDDRDAGTRSLDVDVVLDVEISLFGPARAGYGQDIDARRDMDRVRPGLELAIMTASRREQPKGGMHSPSLVSAVVLTNMFAALPATGMARTPISTHPAVPKRVGPPLFIGAPPASAFRLAYLCQGKLSLTTRPQ